MHNKPKPINLARNEATILKEKIKPEDLLRINFETIDGNSINGQCFYGQLTGDQDGFQAINLICQCTELVICTDPENDGKFVPVTFMRAIKKSYSKGEMLIDGNGNIVDVQERSLHYVSPLELYVPALNDPQRQSKIKNILNWLGL